MSDRQKTRARPNPRRAFAQTYGSVLAEGVSRRTILKGFLASTAVAAIGSRFGVDAIAAAEPVSTATFPELARVRDTADHWPEGYSRQVLLRWGDALFPDSPAFDPKTVNGAAAQKQFGYNNDFTAFLPLPWGEATSDHGLLVVGHEYATPYLMFEGMTADDYRDKLTEDQIGVLMGATGVTVVEVKKTGAEWAVVTDGKYNRRIHMGTEMAISGPAAGDDRLKTKADPTGTLVYGTISNCNGGITPWGTMLSGEEGAMDVFAGDYTTLANQELVERQGWDEDENDIYSLLARRSALQVRRRAQ